MIDKVVDMTRVIVVVIVLIISFYAQMLSLVYKKRRVIVCVGEIKESLWTTQKSYL